MKKFLSMFAFAAAIVLGAFALASCGDDDDIIPVETKHHFTLNMELSSTNPEVLKDADFQKTVEDLKIISKSWSDKLNIYCTDLQAGATWLQVQNSSEWSDVKKSVKKAAQYYDDPSMTIKFQMIKEGKDVFREETYKAFDLLF